MEAGGLVAEAEAILVVEEDGSSTVRGLILGCRSVREGESDSRLLAAGESGSFAFEWSGKGGGFKVVQPVVVPRDFAWAQTPDGVVPAYD